MEGDTNLEVLCLIYIARMLSINGFDVLEHNQQLW